MSAAAPIIFNWNGEAMVPLSRFHNMANANFVVGENYRLAAVEERSVATHNHFFATIHDKWLSLPDAIAVQFATPEALRKHALIMTGFRKERKFVASSPVEARKLAAWLRPQTVDDDYAIISIAGNTVVEWKAASQSLKAMPEKGRFQASKQAVLEWIDDLLGVAPDSTTPEPAREDA
jgi:hypothetical protein